MPVGRAGVSPFAQGQNRVGDHGGADRVQVRWCVLDCGAPGAAHDEPEPEVLREAMGEKCLRAPGRNQAERGHAS